MCRLIRVRLRGRCIILLTRGLWRGCWGVSLLGGGRVGVDVVEGVRSWGRLSLDVGGECEKETYTRGHGVCYTESGKMWKSDRLESCVDPTP